ncbi:low molecular weight phosphotyrosine protein phosphatase-like isoform X2 [Dreissena polymorpha]|uniref:low molecular weight phosphotyrosine protein phosphatase-like isoform X2 n=1 Tax=Dreissena polymorpha TaxID=45954 RepID=UPI00226492CE|nr:low molecular weight phosphotyrosine protein phosphatase-like isoform X2 [Dreissena polymorpha]
MSAKKKSVLFICLGNICRSPMAEAVFLNLLKEQGLTDKWHVDSAALGTWHIGISPDSRTISTLQKHGITTYKHVARVLCDDDYTKFDVIFGMDDNNMSELDEQKPQTYTARLERLGDHDPEGDTIIRDPYFDARGDMSGFEKVYAQCWHVDSAALGTLHIGISPDSRTISTRQKHGITTYKHVARVVRKVLTRRLCDDDYTKFDVIFGMDDNNMSELDDRKPQTCTARLERLGDHDPEGDTIIRDPYFDARGDLSGFEKVYAQCVRSCKAFLHKS